MIPGYECEKEIVQNFCNNLVESKVNTGLLRKMIEFTNIPFVGFENLVKACFQSSGNHVKEYKDRIILLICACQDQSSLMTISHDLVKLITVTASLQYKLMLGNPNKSWDQAVENLLNPYSKYCFSLGILRCIQYNLHFKEVGLSAKNSIKEIHLYCDFLEGKISAQAYKAALYKLQKVDDSLLKEQLQ